MQKFPISKKIMPAMFIQKLKLCWLLMINKKSVLLSFDSKTKRPDVYAVNTKPDEIIKLAGETYVSMLTIKYTPDIHVTIKNS